MKLTVEIDDNELNEIIAKGVKDLSEETITGIAKEAVSAYLQQDKVIHEIIFKSSGYYRDENALRPEIWNMLSNSFSEEEIQKYRQKMIKAIEECGEQIITKTLAQTFSNMLVNTDFRAELSMAFAKIAELSSQERR